MAKSRKKKFNFTALLVLFLAACFVAAVVVYFVRSYNSTEHENAVYSTMEESRLPVVFAMCGDMAVNPMRGHFDTAPAETITVLPENRKLEIKIDTYGSTIAGISYEIWNLSKDHFIEKTTLDDTFKGGSGDKKGQKGNVPSTVNAVLPIQNLIEKEEVYRLIITLDTGEQRINYSTKILWTEKDYAERMLTLAREFNEKTFNYEEARDLTQFMEAGNREPTDDLSHVTLKSTFSQLTWNDTGMKPSSEPEIYLRELSGIMGAVEIIYGTETESEKYNNTDEFTMRIGADRIYIMNYQRSTYEVFDGLKHRFSGKQIMLGITDSSELQTLKSENGQFIAFKTDRELWSFDQENEEAVNIFSFRSEKHSATRDHNIKILSVDNDGTVDFAVYGYMNRGRHEGYNGLVCYSFSPKTDVTTEIFFAPFENSYEFIKEELDELCAKGGNGMFYFKQNNTVYGVDLKSLEMMEVMTGPLYSNGNQTRFAWLDDGVGITVMDLTTGSTRAISDANGDTLKILTFYGDDLVIGRGREAETWYLGKRVRSIPSYKLEIYDDSLQMIMEYGKMNLYVDDFRKTGNRFLFNLYRKVSRNSYAKQSADTIVCSVYEDAPAVSVDLDKEIRNTKKLRISVPESISYESTGTISVRESAEKGLRFLAYANGHYRGSSEKLSEAMEYMYDDMGWITDETGKCIYSRVDRGAYHTIQNPMQKAKPILDMLTDFTVNTVNEDGYLLIDGYGLTPHQALGFVYKNYPVVVIDKNGNYSLIYGFDAKKIKVMEESGNTYTIDRDNTDALGENFLCFTEK